MNLDIAVLAARVGLRVKATRNMHFPRNNVTVYEGACGTTTSATCAGAIVGVRFDGREDQLDVRFDALEVLNETPGAVS